VQTPTHAWKAAAGVDGQRPMQAERLPPGHGDGVGPGGVGPGAGLSGGLAFLASITKKSSAQAPASGDGIWLS